MNRFLLLLAACLTLSVSNLAVAADGKPDWKFEFEQSEFVGYESPSWFEKDDGWLLTFRLTTPSRMAIKPYCYLILEGKDENDEVVWTGDRKLVRRVDMDPAYKGGLDLFVRLFFKGVPESVKSVTVRFQNGTEAEPEGDAE